MRDYFELRLAAPGGPGERSVAQGEGVFKDYHVLHAIFESWLGDELVSVQPCFLVTVSLGNEFRAAGLTGFELATVDVEKDRQFDLAYPGVELPKFLWLKVNGIPGKDDFFITERHRLAVSPKAFDLINGKEMTCMTSESYRVI